jgi:hypothetical protein
MRRVLGFAVLGILLVAGPARADPPARMRVRPPELRGVTEWINSQPLELADLKGEVVVIHFWTFG